MTKIVLPSTKQFFICALLALSVSRTFAAKETGNGGNAILCPLSASYPPARIYDHYEAEAKYGRQLDLGGSQLSVDAKTDLVFTRIARLNPNRALMYRGWYATFWQDANLLPGVVLTPVADTGVGYIPEGCTLAQAATQTDPELPGDKRYLISKDIWDQMDADSQAGLILHELIYREALHQQVPHTNSVMARYLNGFFSTIDMDSATLKTYIQLLQLANYEKADAQQGVPILAGASGSVVFSDANTVSSSAPQVGDFSYVWNGQTLPLHDPSPDNFAFLANGQLKTFNFDPVAIHLKLLLTEHDIDHAGSLEFNDQGQPAQLFGAGIHLVIKGFNGTCSEVDFDNVGNITKCIGSAGVINLAGNSFSGISGGALNFDPAGNLVGALQVQGLAIHTADFAGSCDSGNEIGTTFQCNGATGLWNRFSVPLNISGNATVEIDTLTGQLTLDNGFQADLQTAEFTGSLWSAIISGNDLTGSASGVGKLGGISYSGGGRNGVPNDPPLAVSLNWADQRFAFNFQSSMSSGARVETPNFWDLCSEFTLNEKDGLKCGGPDGAQIRGEDGKFHYAAGFAFATDITGTKVTSCGRYISDCH